jgi:hypothetical protein
MTHKNFAGIAGIVFSVVAVAHAIRFLLAWPVVIGSVTVPVWVSAVAAIFAGYLATQAYRLRK